ncbi:hypothetical protein RBH29_02840 [Herbivorax sp. ANBcel31]|uniref:baseplate J/gp47 family protein n=1 Tax=Herbivorax sp. ANBcel31 TaxID=3069754 RepID=UPI0027AFD527|nr:baseplate J/gp47 family protein [Herbivorax sp. ANBcel31]MDQ2085375.1 hypothetical protein [Herbivorax sp. ANBcel31]
MNIPNIDKRTKDDIIKYIKEVSKHYTPEWRFDTDNPDVGSALALLFADMFEETVSRINQVPYKNYISFLNLIDIKLLPSISAQGIVTFKLSSAISEGIFVKKNTGLLSQTNDDSDKIVFETQNEVYVTPSQIKDIYFLSRIKDKIIRAYSDEEEGKSVSFFDFNNYKNLQKHAIYFCHDDVLKLKNKALVELTIQFPEDEENKDKTLYNLTDDRYTRWVYRSNGKWFEFSEVIKNDDKIILMKDDDHHIENEEFEEYKSCWIGCEARDVHGISQTPIDSIFLKTENTDIKPEKVFSQDIEKDISGFYPFGDEFSVYNDCYISCQEALSKKASNVKINFKLKFNKHKLDVVSPDTDINWKMIMKKSKFKKPEEYNITADKVVWEYWNGAGWARLFIDEKYDSVFGSCEEGEITINFTCPSDIEPVWVNAFYNYWIRVRLISVGNSFKTNGYYISPWIEDVSFNYKYTDKGLNPEKIFAMDNTKISDVTGSITTSNQSIEIFNIPEDREPSMYVGFDKNLQGSPINIFFNLKNKSKNPLPSLRWEYYSDLGEKECWKDLKVVDNTENFEQSGIIAFAGPKGLKKCNLFGKERYWIRAVNIDKQYDAYLESLLPQIEGIYLNSTRIMNVETVPEEMFFIDLQEANKMCQLSHKKVQRHEVWVNEKDFLSEAQIEYQKDLSTEIIWDEVGSIQEIWVMWREVDSFINSNEYDRHYIIDRNEGKVFFGDGIRGKIPPSQETESIKIKYGTGGGEVGNLDACEITRSIEGLRFVNEIFNPVPSYGGYDRETIKKSTRRGKDILKHRGRAVTTGDYEALAMEASRNVIRAKCFSNINKMGKKEAGCVTLVLLQRNYRQSETYFAYEREKIEAYFKGKTMETLMPFKFNIIEPDFIEFSIKVWIKVESINYVFEVQREVYEKLEQFLNPINGNFSKKGWDIGNLPNRTQIYTYLKTIKKVNIIDKMFITASKNCEKGKKEWNIDEIHNIPFAVIISGKHEVEVEVL